MHYHGQAASRLLSLAKFRSFTLNLFVRICTVRIGSFGKRDGLAKRFVVKQKARLIFCILAATVILPTSLLLATPIDKDAATAQNLAAMLRASWTVISNEQNRINDPELGDKDLSG